MSRSERLFDRGYYDHKYSAKELARRKTYYAIGHQLLFRAKWQAYRELIGARQGELVLDVGCGSNIRAFAYLDEKGLEYHGTDFSNTAVAELRRTAGRHGHSNVARLTQGSALSLPYREASFDRVIASEVVEHIQDDVGFLREMTRVLRPGGYLVLTTPSSAHYFHRAQRALLPHRMVMRRTGGHYREYDVEAFEARFGRVGLKYVDHRYVGRLFPYWLLPRGHKIERILVTVLPILKAVVRWWASPRVEPQRRSGLGLIIKAQKV